MKVFNNVWDLLKNIFSLVRHIHKRQALSSSLTFSLFSNHLFKKGFWGYISFKYSISSHLLWCYFWYLVNTYDKRLYLSLNKYISSYCYWPVINHLTLFKPYILLDFFVKNPLMKHISVIWTRPPSMFVKTGGVQSQIDCGPIYLRRSNH